MNNKYTTKCINTKQMYKYTTKIYYSPSENQGWTYFCDSHGRYSAISGGLVGFENENKLTFAEAKILAKQALKHDDEVSEVQVFWHGDADPLIFSFDELI